MLGIDGAIFHSGFNSARIDGLGVYAYCLVMEKMHETQERHDTEMRNIIEEARVVLPGIQALFGFQMIAVFNERFDAMAEYAKACHVLGLIMVIVSIAMVMTPAVYYRTCHGHANAPMVRLSARMIRGALCPLAIGLALDMFTVLYVVSEDLSARMAISVGVALGTLALLSALWFLVPIKGRAAQRTDTRH